MSLKHPTPASEKHPRVAYVAPLTDGQPPESYLFAISRSPTSDLGIDLNVLLSNFVDGFGAQWNDGAVVTTVDLQTPLSDVLPVNMLLRDQISAADWRQSEPLDIPVELVLNTGRGVVVLREDIPARRRAAGLDVNRVPTNWYPDGPIWKGARTLVLVDLDDHALGLAEAAARYGLAGYYVASGQSPSAQGAIAGHAQEWDGSRGEFRSVEETRQRVEDECSDAAARIGAQRYGFSDLFDRTTRRSLKTALRAHANQSDRSAKAEWRETRTKGLREVLNAEVPAQLHQLSQELSADSLGPLSALTKRLPAALARLISGARTRLRSLIADRLLGTARVQRWPDSTRSKKRRTTPPPNLIIEQMERERIESELNLTAVERDLLDAMEHEIPLTQWALEQQMPLSDARKLLNSLRLRAKETLT